ncbi:MAG TPA: hypothetical protein DIT32_06745 [Peptococcaceae bacterium]|nr:hypothetical protein [Peptococcaceae bacterium]
MEKDESAFFAEQPEAALLYEAIKAKLRTYFNDATIKVTKSQIAFASKRNFAFVWLPMRKMKHRPEVYIILSFGLDHRIQSPRIEEAVEAYPCRWTHHMIIQDPAELDGEVMDWLQQAYAFSQSR